MNRTHIIERDEATGRATVMDAPSNSDRLGGVPLAVIAAASLATTMPDLANEPAHDRPRFLNREQPDARTYVPRETQEGVVTAIAPLFFTQIYSLYPDVTSSSLLGLDGPWLGGVDLSAALPASPWANLLSDVGRWLFLPEGWDDTDSVPPSKVAVDEARAFARILRDRGAPLPQHFVSPDGEISLDWRKGQARASLAFTGDGAILGYLRKGEGQPIKAYETLAGQGYDWSDFLNGLSVFT